MEFPILIYSTLNASRKESYISDVVLRYSAVRVARRQVGSRFQNGIFVWSLVFLLLLLRFQQTTQTVDIGDHSKKGCTRKKKRKKKIQAEYKMLLVCSKLSQ